MSTKTNPGLTAERLRELLTYDPKTGRFFWKQSRGSVAAGSEAGTLNDQGRVNIMVDGRLYKRSRLAHLHVTGDWPKQFADHRNGIRDDDRWSNLRDASPSENSQNRVLASAHGTPGVAYDPRCKTKPWRAYIKANGRQKSLGNYASKQEAAAAREAAAKKLHGKYAASARPTKESANYVSFSDVKLGERLFDFSEAAL